MTTHLHTRRCMSKLHLYQRRTHLRMIQDLLHACESIAFHFWYRHACVMYVLFTMWSKLWIDIFVLMMFFERKTFLARFFCLRWKETWETSVHDAWTFRRVARTTSFWPWSCRCHARRWENIFHPLFSEPSTETSWRVKIWRAALLTPVRMAALWTSSVSRDPVLSFGPGRKRWSTRDAFVVTWNSRSFNLFGNEETSHKDWNPFKTAGENVSSTQRSEKSQGSDRSGWTNFVNLKRKLFLSKLFLRTVFKFKCWHYQY